MEAEIDKDKPAVDPNALPVEGMGHLFPENKEGEEKKEPEPGAVAASEKADDIPQEEVLDMEAFSAKFGNTKVKVQIAGEEHLLSPSEAIKFQQKNQGLEKTADRKIQEAISSSSNVNVRASKSFMK